MIQWYLPGQDCVLHSRDSDSSLPRMELLPVIKHDNPPNCAAGLSHRRVRACEPLPQVLEHEP